jgi:thioesterase domain-containing protein
VGWGKYTTGPVRTDTIDADHFSLMRTPAVGVLAEHLTAFIGQPVGAAALAASS